MTILTLTLLSSPSLRADTAIPCDPINTLRTDPDSTRRTATLIDVDATIYAGESRQTSASIPVRPIYALATIEARVLCTVVDI